MGSKAPATQTVKNETVADPTTKAWQGALFNNATNLYGQGPAQFFPGQTVAPYTQQTLTGLNMMQNQAQQGAFGLPQAQNSAMRLMSGYVPGMHTAMNAANGGMQNPFAGMIQSAANQQIAPQVQPQLQQAQQSAQQVAQAGGTPTTAGTQALNSFQNMDLSHLNDLYSQGADQIGKDLNARFAQAGRTGMNAAFGNTLGKSLGNLYTSVFAPGVEAAQDRKMSAANSLAGISQADRAASMQGNSTAAQLGMQNAGMYGDFLNSDAARQFQGANNLAGLSESGFDRQLSGAQLAGGMWGQGNQDALAGMNSLAGLYQYAGMPAEQMLGVGGALETMDQAQIDAARERWDFEQNAGWNNLGRMASVMQGLPDFSSQTQTTTGPKGSRGMGLLGGAASGAGIGMQFGGPMGAGIGAGLGGLFGLFS